MNTEINGKVNEITADKENIDTLIDKEKEKLSNNADNNNINQCQTGNYQI